MRLKRVGCGHMRGINHLKSFTIIVFVLISMVVIGYSMNVETFNPLPVRVVKDGMTLVETAYINVIDRGKQLLVSVVDLFHTYEENQQLKNEMYNYEALEAYTLELEETVSSLEAVLETGTSLTDYETMTATTVMRNIDQWHDFIVVNKGVKNGVEEDMAILSREGFLIGKVVEVNEQSSKVKLIKNQDFGSKVSAIVTGEENSIGTVEGYDYKTNELVMTQVSKDVEIVKGDKVITSGLGGVYPEGLLIGNVVRVEVSADGLTQTLYLQGEKNYDNLDYVILVNRKAVKVEND